MASSIFSPARIEAEGGTVASERVPRLHRTPIPSASPVSTFSSVKDAGSTCARRRRIRHESATPEPVRGRASPLQIPAQGLGVASGCITPAGLDRRSSERDHEVALQVGVEAAALKGGEGPACEEPRRVSTADGQR
eukprot:6104870-Prymnesium_polylepis.2